LLGYNGVSVWEIAVQIKKIQTTQFKAKCLQIVDQVVESRQPVLILKDGKPVARLVPESPKTRAIIDRYKGKFESHGDLTESPFSEDDWECLK
jgi:prevent-host-death family protein